MKKNNPPKNKRKSFKTSSDSCTNTFSNTYLYKSCMAKDKLNNKNKSPKNEIIIYKTEENSTNEKKIINKNLNDYELNSLSYEEALIYDKRIYIQYYLSLLRTKHLFIFSFYPNNDYNSYIIKVCLFFFSFGLYFTVNTLFYTDSTMHKIYEDNGSFDFIYHIPQIIYSTIISTVINTIVKTLSITEKNILKIKNEKDYKNSKTLALKVLNCLKIKFICFYIFSFIFLIFFWYYLGCFCAVYKNTQKHLIKDTGVSFLLSLIYPFGINLLPGLFRIPSLKDKNKNKKCIYNLSKIIQLI